MVSQFQIFEGVVTNLQEHWQPSFSKDSATDTISLLNRRKKKIVSSFSVEKFSIIILCPK